MAPAAWPGGAVGSLAICHISAKAPVTRGPQRAPRPRVAPSYRRHSDDPDTDDRDQDSQTLASVIIGRPRPSAACVSLWSAFSIRCHCGTEDSGTKCGADTDRSCTARRRSVISSTNAPIPTETVKVASSNSVCVVHRSTQPRSIPALPIVSYILYLVAFLREHLILLPTLALTWINPRTSYWIMVIRSKHGSDGMARTFMVQTPACGKARHPLQANRVRRNQKASVRS
jgi:hypothetical protein